MISVVGKVMPSLAAIEYYNKTLTHRPARLISIALRSTGMRSSVN